MTKMREVMIPEHRLIHSLIKIQQSKEIKQAIKSATKSIKYKRRKKLYRFVSNVNETRVFNHFIGLDAHLNNYQLDSYYSNIIDFNFLLVGLMPIFEYQKLSYKKYNDMQKILQTHALLNPKINKWYQESQIKDVKELHPDLIFFLKNNRISQTIKQKIVALTHICGKLFETFKNTDYQLGYYFMLFYLITLETKQTLILKSDTNWNLKFYFLPEDFFSYKLIIIEKFSQILMNNEGKNFNLYLRVINSFINKNSD